MQFRHIKSVIVAAYKHNLKSLEDYKYFVLFSTTIIVNLSFHDFAHGKENSYDTNHTNIKRYSEKHHMEHLFSIR